MRRVRARGQQRELGEVRCVQKVLSLQLSAAAGEEESQSGRLQLALQRLRSLGQGLGLALGRLTEGLVGVKFFYTEANLS